MLCLPGLKDVNNMLKFFMDALVLVFYTTTALIPGSVKPTLQTTVMAHPGVLRFMFPASSRRGCDDYFYFHIREHL
jgi:hypothetical protein